MVDRDDGVSDPSEPESPVISAQDAARAVCALFLANAERDDNAGNDELVAEVVHRIRAQQSRDHHNSQSPAPEGETAWVEPVYRPISAEPTAATAHHRVRRCPQ